MAIITSVTRPAESGATNSSEFAINGLPVQIQATGNTVGSDLKFNGVNLSLAQDTATADSVTSISVNGGPIQSTRDATGTLQLVTPTGTIQSLNVNGATATLDTATGIASLTIPVGTGTVTGVTINGVTGTTIDGMVTLQAGTVSGVTINGGPIQIANNGVIGLNNIGQVNSISINGVVSMPDNNGLVTLPSSSATTITGIVINGHAPITPDADGKVNLGTVGTVRQIQINGITGTTNETTGLVSLVVPTGNVNTVSINGGVQLTPLNGNINLVNVGTIQSVTLNNNILTPINGNLNLGTISTITGITVNNVNASVTNGQANVIISTNPGTVTGVSINGGPSVLPVGGIVNLTMVDAANSVKYINANGLLLSPVNGVLTLPVQPVNNNGSPITSISVNGGAAVTPNSLGGVSLTGIGTISGVTVNGSAPLVVNNGVVSIVNVGNVSGVTINGSTVQTASNGVVNITGVGRVNRVIVNTIEATVGADGTATVTIPTDTNSVKTITVNGGSPIFPLSGNVAITLPVTNNSNSISGVTVNGSAITSINGIVNLTNIGSLNQLRINGNLLTAANGEIDFTTSTITGITVNNGSQQVITNGVVNIPVQAPAAGAQSITINGGPLINSVAGNIALTNIGTVTGATINGSAVKVSVNGVLDLTGFGTVNQVNVGSTSYTPLNGIITLPATSSTSSALQTISLNGGIPVSPSSGNINLIVGTLSGVTVNGVVANVTNGQASLSIAIPNVPVKGVNVDGTSIVPDVNGNVNLSLAYLAKSATFLGETQMVTSGGTFNLPSTVGTVKGITLNSGTVITPTVNGIINLVLASGQTSGIQSLLVNGAAVSANNGVASFVTPQGTVTGITINGSVTQLPVNGVVALTVSSSQSGIQTVSLNGNAVSVNSSNGNANITGVVTNVTVNGGIAQTADSNGNINIVTPVNFIKTISINGGTVLAPISSTGNLNLTLASGQTSGVQGVTINGGNVLYPTNGVLNLPIASSTNYVKSLVINGVSGSPDSATGIVNLTIPGTTGGVKSITVNNGSQFTPDAQGNVNISATIGSGTVTGIQINGAAIQAPNPSGTLVLTGISTITGLTINGNGSVFTATNGQVNLANVGTIQTIQANGRSYTPSAGSTTVNLGTLGVVNTISLNGGTQIAAVNGNVDLSGFGTVTGATVNGGPVVTANNGILNLTLAGGSTGGVQAVSLNGGAAVYPQGGVVNLAFSTGTGTVTGVTVNGGTEIAAIGGVVALTGLGNVTGATINGGAVITANAGKLNLTGVGTVTGVTFNGGLTQIPTNGLVSLTYSPPTDNIKSVIVNNGTAQYPVNGVLNLTVPTGTTSSGSSSSSSIGQVIRSISVNGALAINPDNNGLAQINVGTVKGVKYNSGSPLFPDPSTGIVDLGTIATTSSGGGSSTYSGPSPTGQARKVIMSDGTVASYQYQKSNDVIGGTTTYNTYALATAASELPFRTFGQTVKVLNDPAAALNGVYIVANDNVTLLLETSSIAQAVVAFPVYSSTGATWGYPSIVQYDAADGNGVQLYQVISTITTPASQPAPRTSNGVLSTSWNSFPISSLPALTRLTSLQVAGIRNATTPITGTNVVITLADLTAKVPTTTDGLAEGNTNLYFTQSRVLSTVISGYTKSATNTPILVTDTELAALGKLEKKADDNTALINPIIRTITVGSNTGNGYQAPVSVGGYAANVTGLESASVGGGAITISGSDCGTVGGYQLTIPGQACGAIAAGYSQVTGSLGFIGGVYGCYNRSTQSAIIGSIGCSLPLGADQSVILGGYGFTPNPISSSTSGGTTVFTYATETVYVPQITFTKSGSGITFKSPTTNLSKLLSINDGGSLVYDGNVVGYSSPIVARFNNGTLAPFATAQLAASALYNGGGGTIISQIDIVGPLVLQGDVSLYAPGRNVYCHSTSTNTDTLTLSACTGTVECRLIERTTAGGGYALVINGGSPTVKANTLCTVGYNAVYSTNSVFSYYGNAEQSEFVGGPGGNYQVVLQVGGSIFYRGVIKLNSTNSDYRGLQGYGNASVDFNGTIIVTNKGYLGYFQGASTVSLRGSGLTYDRGILSFSSQVDIYMSIDTRNAVTGTTLNAPLIVAQNGATPANSYTCLHTGCELLAPAGIPSIYNSNAIVGAYEVRVSGTIVQTALPDANTTLRYITLQSNDNYAVLAYTPTINIDFTAASVRTVSLTGPVTFGTSANITQSKTKRVLLTNTTTSAQSVTLNSSWHATLASPISVPAGKSIVLGFEAITGGTEADLYVIITTFVS